MRHYPIKDIDRYCAMHIGKRKRAVKDKLFENSSCSMSVMLTGQETGMKEKRATAEKFGTMKGDCTVLLRDSTSVSFSHGFVDFQPSIVCFVFFRKLSAFFRALGRSLLSFTRNSMGSPRSSSSACLALQAALVLKAR